MRIRFCRRGREAIVSVVFHRKHDIINNKQQSGPLERTIYLALERRRPREFASLYFGCIFQSGQCYAGQLSVDSNTSLTHKLTIYYRAGRKTS